MWTVESITPRRISAKSQIGYRATNGALVTAPSTIREEAQAWCDMLNSGHRPTGVYPVRLADLQP